MTALAFERAFRKRGGFDARRGSERAWLFGIARNAALDELRKRKRSRLAGRRARLQDARPRPRRGHGPRAAPRGRPYRAGRAPPRDRELIALKFHAGLDNAEIAAVLGVSASNAGTRLHRALTKLREMLDDQS